MTAGRRGVRTGQPCQRGLRQGLHCGHCAPCVTFSLSPSAHHVRSCSSPSPASLSTARVCLWKIFFFKSEGALAQHMNWHQFKLQPHGQRSLLLVWQHRPQCSQSGPSRTNWLPRGSPFFLWHSPVVPSPPPLGLPFFPYGTPSSSPPQAAKCPYSAFVVLLSFERFSSQRILNVCVLYFL